jgi:long-chain acyl-CoA synthetase
MCIKDMLENQKKNDNTALIYANEYISYRELYDTVHIVSHELASQCEGYRSIGLFIHNSINYIAAYFSISFTGHVIVPINSRIKANELESTIHYCELGVIVTDTLNIDLLRKCLKDFPYLIKAFNMDTMSFESMGGNESIPVIEGCELDDVALMLHTSGSLSSPKRVMLTHHNLITCVEAIIESLEITRADRTLIALPLFLASANTSQMLAHIYLGASIVIMDALFTAGYFFKLVERHGVTNFTGVPYMMQLLADNKNTKAQDISSLRFICFGGAPTPVEKIRKLIASFSGVDFIHMYGQTEASTRISHLLPDRMIEKAGSVGKPLPGMEWKLVNEEGSDVGMGEVGELLVKGGNIMKGYYKRNEQTLTTLMDGWLHTGDLGRFDEEGFLYIVGRMRNVIIKGGMNIYPEEIEEILCSHPAVKEACVTGEKDDLLGEVPVAKVVLKDPSINIRVEELMRFCVEKLSSFKVPARIQMAAELPRTETGKIKRF